MKKEFQLFLRTSNSLRNNTINNIFIVKFYLLNTNFIHFQGGRGPLVFPGWYPRDHKPDPYPKNKEERRLAAIKYGLRPEDYK